MPVIETTLGPIDLVVSPSAGERLREARERAAAWARDTEALVIAPGRAAADDFARAVARDRGAIFGLHRASFLELVVTAAAPRLAASGLAPATRLGVEALAARAAFEAAADGELHYFSPVSTRPGFRRALAATLAELRAHDVDVADLAHADRVGPDLAACMERLDCRMRAAGIADRAALVRLAAEAVAAGEVPLVSRRHIVCLDVPLRTAAEAALVEALARASGRTVVVTVPAGDDKTIELLERLSGGDGSARHAALRTTSLAPSHGIATSGTALARVRDGLFGTHREANGFARDGDSSVVLFSAPGEGRECVEIARRVLLEAAAGRPFDRMAVLLRAPRAYARLLESALGRAGIPAWFARGTQRPDPSGRALLALIACARDGLSASRFAEYLSLGQAPAVRLHDEQRADDEVVLADDEMLRAGIGPEAEGDTGARPSRPADRERDRAVPQPWRWERLLVDAAVIGGHDRWRRRLDGLANELDRRIQTLRAEEPDSPRLGWYERERERLDALRAFALPIIDELASWPAAATWGEWIGRLEALAPRVLARPERPTGMLATLRPMKDVGPVSLDEVLDVLRPWLQDLQVEPPAHREGRLFVGAVDDARGREFEVVFVPGVAERVFPQRARQDPLLLDDVRARLDRALPTDPDRVREERLLLRLAAGAARERLYVSWPRLDFATARARVPSFYALDIVRAVRGRVPDPEVLSREAALEGDARLAWPAPGDAARAIDRAEHDLSNLARLLAEPDREARRGGARYLLELDRTLARSLRAQHQRWAVKRWGEQDGLCTGAASDREALARHRLRSRPYSVTALQRFATCPYQFLLAAIYRLEPRVEPTPVSVLDPLTRGSLFHEVQAAVIRDLLARGAFPVPADRLESERARLDVLFDTVSARWRDLLAPPVERVWLDELESLRTDLRGWLDRLLLESGGWVPAHVELAFGLPDREGRDPASRREPVAIGDGFLLHGSVDLVERNESGALRMTDHKTGRRRVPSGSYIGGGEHLQPVLYSLAVERALGADVREARLFYCTRAGEYASHLVPLTGPVGAEARRTGIEALEIIDRAIEQGLLPAAPVAGACDRCDFRVVCGPHESRRCARKARPVPGDVEAIRRLR